ncbi:FAD-binding protein [Polaromonas sp.]|uniref:FAD-binding protein n=1 Tax=Polaromonas sp. TaxID=1869339 RepID=UPI003BACA847
MSPKNTDLAILGAGAAGMMAALCAADRGMHVALFDPFWSTLNNLELSGGLFPAAGSQLQSMAGVDDSPGQWLADLRAYAGSSVNECIAAPVAQSLPQVVAFLVERMQMPVRFLADVPAPGHGAVRFHSVTPASGPALSDCLRRAVRAHPLIDCRVDVVVSRMERAEKGFELIDAARHTHARQLLLAGGGFGGAADMVTEFIPEMSGALHSGSPTNDGSVIGMARAWGAALAGMDGYQGQGHTHPGGHTRLGMSIPTLGGIMVDRSGQRFVREDIGPSALAAKVLAQPGQLALEVFDAAIEARLGNHSAYAAAKAAGRVLEADTLEELARAAGVPAHALADSVALAVQCAESASDSSDPLGRARFAQPLAAPYRASWVTGSLAHTQGGIVTDGRGRVLMADGQAILHLYAAGGCAAGLSGQGGDGYLPGNGLAQSFGLAFNAVAAMAGD